MDAPEWERLAAAVRQRREDLGGLSQAQVAHDAGLSVATWGKVENAKDSVKPRTLRRIDVGLQWPPGTAQAILRGVNPATMGRMGDETVGVVADTERRRSPRTSAVEEDAAAWGSETDVPEVLAEWPDDDVLRRIALLQAEADRRGIRAEHALELSNGT